MWAPADAGAADSLPSCCAHMEKGHPCQCDHQMDHTTSACCGDHCSCDMPCGVSHVPAAALAPAPVLILSATRPAAVLADALNLPASPVETASKPPRL